MKIQFFLIRHGKTEANLQYRYLGRTDEELCEIGKKELLEKRLHIPEVDYVYASSMLRCKQTCDILFPGKKYETMDGFTEMDFGDFENKNYEELKNNEEYQKWIDSNGTIPFPNGESREEFIKRNKQAFFLMCQKLEERNKNENLKVAVVIHGGSIMALLSSITGGEYFDFQCKNGEGYIFDWEDGKFKNMQKI